MTDTVLYTQRGVRDYQFLDPAPIRGAFLHGADYDIRLMGMHRGEFAHLPQQLGAPTTFMFDRRTLTLFPTPDREYELHFEREVALPPFAPLHSFPDGLHVRWLTAYMVATDTMLTRFCARVGEPFRVPMHEFNHFSEREYELALRHYRPQIEECMRRARETPGQQFSCDWHLRRHELEDAASISRLDILRMRPGRYNGYADNATGEQQLVLGLNNPNTPEYKSIKLLKTWLTASQREEYEKSCQFTVCGSETGTRYRLISAHSYNILELNAQGEPNGNKFCVVPIQSVAMGDQLLAQKIWLETDETRTLKIANKILRQDLEGTSERARGMLGVAQITRDAIQMWRNSNAFLERHRERWTEVFGEPDRPPQVGQQLRVRLPVPGWSTLTRTTEETETPAERTDP